MIWFSQQEMIDMMYIKTQGVEFTIVLWIITEKKIEEKETHSTSKDLLSRE